MDISVEMGLTMVSRSVRAGTAAGPGRAEKGGGPTSPRRWSVHDVAALAGVSSGTVSNVLNRPERVASATAERVRRVMDELGFVRNRSGRVLRAGESRTVGAVMLDLSNPFFGEIVKGIESRLGDEDLVLLLCSSHNCLQTELEQLRTLEEERVLGILVAPLGRDMAQIDALRRRGTRVVLLDRADPRTEICSVSVDHARGGELAVEHLLSQGHKRVVFINGPRSVRQYAERRRGALRAVQKRGLDPKAMIEVTVPAANPEGGERGIEMLLEAGLPSAIFCTNDYIALGVLRALRASGVSVPDDVAVVGYDDVEVAAMLSTPLTSVRQPMYELGREATTLLLEEAYDEGHRHQKVRFAPELMVRGSSCG